MGSTLPWFIAFGAGDDLQDDQACWSRKKATRLSDDGLSLHSFDSLIAELGTRCQNTCRLKASPGTPTFVQTTEPTATQRRAKQLIDTFPVDHLP